MLTLPHKVSSTVFPLPSPKQQGANKVVLITSRWWVLSFAWLKGKCSIFLRHLFQEIQITEVSTVREDIIFIQWIQVKTKLTIMVQWNLFSADPILSDQPLLSGHQFESLIFFAHLLQNKPGFSGHFCLTKVDTNSKAFCCTKPSISGHFNGFLLLKA